MHQLLYGIKFHKNLNTSFYAKICFLLLDSRVHQLGGISLSYLELCVILKLNFIRKKIFGLWIRKKGIFGADPQTKQSKSHINTVS